MFGDVTVDFPFDGEGKPKPVVLIGVNGAGKSTILDVTSKVLTYINDWAFRKGYPYEELILTDDDIKQGASQVSVSCVFDVYGEKMLLLLVCDITKHLLSDSVHNYNFLNTKGIVLIDEIDLHLHPSWQKSVIKGLQATFPNIQFIVTTHSPLIINHVPQESVLVLKDGDCFPMSSHPFNSYGADVEDIYTIVQGVDSLLPEEIGNKLQTLFRLIDEDKIEEAKALGKDLEKLIDPHHPELLKGQTLMDFKAFSR